MNWWHRSCVITSFFLSSIIIVSANVEYPIKLSTKESISTTTTISCGSNSFLCKDRLKCIKKSEVCNFEEDCFDGSDEVNCAHSGCRSGQFQCKKSKKCLPDGWKCDGTPDCGFGSKFTLDLDLSDENDEECTDIGHSCAKNYLKCQDGFSCVLISNLCDGFPDCPNGWDEMKETCGNTTICNSASHCKYGCKQSQNGPVCYCPIGKEFNGSDCIESNECLIDGSCDQTCRLNAHNVKTCECVKGFNLINSKECKAIDVPKGSYPVLLFQNQYGINVLNLNGTKVSKSMDFSLDLKNTNSQGLIYRQNFTLGLTYDHFNQTLCWIQHSNKNAHTLQCAPSTNLSNYWDKGKPYIYSFQDVYEAAYDWVSHNFYFVDDEKELIFLCNYELTICRTVVDSEVSKVKSIKLDPNKGYIFYTVWGRSGSKLVKASMDGSVRKNLVNSKIVYPDGLTLDLQNSKIYWVDRFLDSIERISYDGGNRRTIFRGINQMRSITVFENDLYVTSERDILRLHKFNPNSYETIAQNVSKSLIYNLHVYHRVTQPHAHNPIGCEDIQITWHEDPFLKCLCREGFMLASNGKSCTKKSGAEFLIYSQHDGIRSMSLPPNISSGDEMIPLISSLPSPSFDFHASTYSLFYTDAPNFTIMKKGLWGSESSVVVDGGVTEGSKLALDWGGSNLYWGDGKLGSIYVTNVERGGKKKLLVNSGLEGLSALTLSPSHGYMFWSLSSKSDVTTQNGCIERAWMNGLNRTKIVDKLFWPIGLTVDHQKSHLYWIDAYAFKIERIHILTNMREVVYTRSHSDYFDHPTSISFFKDFLYVSFPGNFTKISTVVNESQKLDFYSVEGMDQLRVYDASLQEGLSGCSGDNECPDLCFSLPSPPFSSCECSDNYTPSPDSKSCIPSPSNTSNLCNATQFGCSRLPLCVPLSVLCNGVDDCGDGSDEGVGDGGPCAVEGGLCGQSYFECGRRGNESSGERESSLVSCIPRQLLCDGKEDCGDGSDEEGSFCSSSTASSSCHPSEFKCQSSGRCIPLSWVCDSSLDCTLSGILDTSDEGEQCEKQPKSCSPLEFQCDNGFCIPLQNRCDGVSNCLLDDSDEKNCETHCRNITDMFWCGVDGSCFNRTKVCNGVCECSDGSDEVGCSVVPPCVSSSHYLPSDNCSLDSYFDNIVSKEECHNITCGHNTLRCTNSPSVCIPHSFRCDGVKDCPDGSDEESCPVKVPECKFPSRLCNDKKKCVDVTELCNGVNDCDDASDEGVNTTSFCHVKECSKPSVRSSCSHLCANSPEGHFCYCPPGLTLSPDSHTCTNSTTNPCNAWGACSQLCRRVNNRPLCFCGDGYMLKGDGFSCRATSGGVPYLIFSNRHELRGINLKTLSYSSLISNLRNSIAIDFYIGGNGTFVFWTDVLDDKIYRGTLNSGALVNIEVVIQTGLATAEGLAVDWIGQNLYWVESNLDQIEVAKLNGSYRKTLISGQMVSPRSIALDPSVGLIFWTDWDSEAPRIESASMSGDERKIVRKVGETSWPNGLTLDLVNKRIFYCDARLDSIHSIRYDGSDLVTILEDHEELSHPFSITLFESTLYYSDWRSNSIISVSKYSHSNVTTVHRTYTQPFDVKIVHPSRQPQNMVNPCAKTQCSHLCLLSTDKKFKCSCPHLMKLSNSTTCSPYEKIILFARVNEIRAIYLGEPEFYATPPLTVSLVINPNNLDYVAKEKRIYYLDSVSGGVRGANITSPQVTTLQDGGGGKTLGIGVDWISGLIFMAVSKGDKTSLLVSDLSGELVSLIIESETELGGINSISVNPQKGELYFADGLSPKSYKILKLGMNGQNKEILCSSTSNSLLEKPMSLSLDLHSSRLYWINYNEERLVQYYNFNSKKVESVESIGELRPSVISIYKNLIYFASQRHNAILKGDKTTGKGILFVKNNTESINALRIYDQDEQNGSNGCGVRRGGCEHLCLPLSGFRKECRCAIGFTIDSKNISRCLKIDPVLIYADSSGISGISTNSENKKDLLVPIPLLTFPSALDVDEKNNHIYILDSDKGRVSRVNRIGGERRTLFSSPDSILSISIDWNSQIIYFINSKDSLIELANLNGSSRSVLIHTDLVRPLTLTTDPTNGLLFFTDISKKTLERATLDGKNRLILVENTKIFDIGLDTSNKLVYFTDSVAIYTVSYSGGHVGTIIEPSNLNINSILYYNNVLYFTNISTSSASILFFDTRAKTKSIRELRANLSVSIKDLTILTNGERQKKVSNSLNSCGANNGGCDDLCLFNGTHSNCFCAYGKLGASGKNCENFQSFIAYSRVQSIETVNSVDNIKGLGVSYGSSPYPPIQSSEHIRNAIGLAYNYEKQTFFYSDVQLGTINSVFFNGTNFAVVVEKQGSVEGLYFESAHNDLYWTCSNDASINRINPYHHIRGSHSRRVEKVIRLGPNDRPRGIATDPCKHFIFWTNWDANSPSIQRSLMSGLEMTSIITKDIRMPNGLCLDQPNSHLYFIDARLDKIERVNYDGTNRRLIGKDKPKHAFAIALLGDYLYWSDWVLMSILSANKYTGEEVLVLRRDVPKPMGIIGVTPPPSSSSSSNSSSSFCSSPPPCSLLNGGCSDKCSVGKGGEVECSCGEGGKILIGEGRCVSGGQGRNCSWEREFQCESGYCIPYTLACDGVDHCFDKSDENEIYCSTRECRKGFIRGSGNRCLAGSYDDSLIVIKSCLKNQIKCSDGRCVNNAVQCTEYENSSLVDIIDRNGNRKIECPPRALKCKDNSGCYLPSWKCDLEKDCSDGSDEENCLIKCRRDQFHCNKSGECINILWQCDGTADCVDGTDEINCGNRTCDPETHFQCNITRICIPIQWVCDGEGDCPIVGKNIPSDEDPLHCSSLNITHNEMKNTCTSTQFMCLNNLCISRDYLCDRDEDCHSGEDELDCVYGACEGKNSFACGNGHCIPPSSVCNGVPDCIDNTDELNCSKEPFCSSPTEFLCQNKVCINESLVCQGHDDCGDYSDEILCNINECEESPNLCEHICTDAKIGYTCSCSPGFSLSSDNSSCTDTDECLSRPCSQLCSNSLGSYSCSCSPGFVLKSDFTTCKLMSSSTPSHVKILFSNQYYIRSVEVDGGSGGEEILYANLTNAVGLDYDYGGECVYFTDVTLVGSSIKRACGKSGGNIEVIHNVTLQNPDGIAVDWVGGNIYFCDKGTDTIEVSKLDGSFRKVLVSEGLKEPRAIALHPFKGQCFWTDWGENPYIGRVGMDGSNSIVLISDNLGWPNALTLSLETNEIWWADAKEDYIAVADLNGQNRKIVYSRALNNPTAKVHHIFSITVFEDFIYYTDWELKSIEKCHKYTGANHSTVTRAIHRPMDVKIYHPLRQPPLVPNPCSDNGGCPALCLLKPGGGKTCACPENFILSPDGKSCDANCTSSHFVCQKTKKCLPLWWKCDGQDDCGDGEDEPPNCPKFVCTPGQYQCADGVTCLHPTQICDNKIDCINGTDEENCDEHSCFSTQFKCKGNGVSQAYCIPSQKVCDGTNDCSSGEDEQNCLPLTCENNQFKCNNSRCISAEWVCDGDGDCLNGEDELQNCLTRTCAENQFRCSTGKCIPTQWMCDGEMDCKGGEDEEKCEGTEMVTCDPTYFRCNDNKCIPGRWRCDFDSDCNDSSDELNCVPRNCSESEFKCKEGRCIRGSFQCNGEYDCGGLDQSDEENCPINCSSDHFTCQSPQFCISKAFVCDGENDCSDGSDEFNCTKVTCPPSQFLCNSGLERCISNAFVCDSENDCFDGSDELPEMCEMRPCAPGRFRCTNNVCIPYNLVCNGISDCQDGKDELGPMCAGKFMCQSSTQFFCENRICINASLQCDRFDDCGDNSDEKDCPDCPFGTCSQICIFKKHEHLSNSAHNYSCECHSGYSMSPSHTSCKATNEDPYLVLGTESDLKRLNPHKSSDGESVHLLSMDNGGNGGLANKIQSVDYLSDGSNNNNNGGIHYYWSSSSLKLIQSLYVPPSSLTNSLHHGGGRKRRSGPNVKTIISGLEEPRGIAVCWISHRIYFIDAGYDRISVSNLDGTNRLVLISTGLTEPHDIVLEPLSARMFWSDLSGRIEVSFMDGGGRKVLLNSPCPAGLTIDYASIPKRLYWADIKSHSIESSTLEGKDRRVIRRFIKNDLKPYHVELFEDMLYITTYHSNRVIKMNKFGKGNHTDMTTTLLKPADLVIVQSHKRDHFENGCDKLRCSPPGLCLLNASFSGTCNCPDSGLSVHRGGAEYECISHSTPLLDSCNMSCKQGKCLIGPNGPYCQCNPLFEGPNCEKYRCSGYCLNKGLCFHSNDIGNIEAGEPIPLKCNCPPNFTGVRCEISLCPKCENGGVCANSTCSCSPGYHGLTCEKCSELECGYGGICRRDKKGRPSCNCPQGLSGTHCEKSEGRCTCSGRGKCKNSESGECICNQGYGGLNCELDLCSNLCKNGGTCLKKSSGIVCSCPSPFVGANCDVYQCDCLKCRPTDWNCIKCPKDLPPECMSPTQPVGKCPSDYCVNGGNCQMIKDTPVCSCPEAWVGFRCELPSPKSNPCLKLQCLHSGICVLPNLAKKPFCVCKPEWSGQRCQHRNSCYGFCFNGGSCKVHSEASSEPLCTCPPSFTGSRCESIRRNEEISSLDPGGEGITWILVLIFIVVAVGVAGLSGCIAYVVMRRKQGRPFMHVRMHDNRTVEVNNPMFLKEEGDDILGSEQNLAFDPDKVLLQGTNFANPLYTEVEGSGANDEKKGLLEEATSDNFLTSIDHPLAHPLT